MLMWRWWWLSVARWPKHRCGPLEIYVLFPALVLTYFNCIYIASPALLGNLINLEMWWWNGFGVFARVHSGILKMEILRAATVGMSWLHRCVSRFGMCEWQPRCPDSDLPFVTFTSVFPLCVWGKEVAGAGVILLFICLETSISWARSCFRWREPFHLTSVEVWLPFVGGILKKLFVLH